MATEKAGNDDNRKWRELTQYKEEQMGVGWLKQVAKNCCLTCLQVSAIGMCVGATRG